MFTRIYTKFSMPGLLVVLSNRNRKMRPHRIRDVTMLRAPYFFYAVQKGFLLRNLRSFPDIDNKFQNPALSGGIFAPISVILTASVLVLMCRI